MSTASGFFTYPGNVISRFLFENSPDSIFIQDEDGFILDVNRAACELQGIEHHDLAGMNIRELVPPARVDALLERNKLWFTGKITFSEGRVYSHNGKIIPVEIHGIRIPSPEKPCFLFILREKTRPVSEPAYINPENSYYENLFKAAPEAIVITDKQSRIQRINDQFTALFGYTAAEVRGKSTQSILVPPDKMAEGAAFNATVNKKRSTIKETRRMDKDGRQIYVSIVGAPIVINKNQTGVFKLYRNITEQKRIKEALLQSKEKLRNIFRSSPDPIVLTSLAGTVIDRNEAALELFKFPGDGREQDVSCLRFVSPTDQKRARGFMKTIINKGHIKNKTLSLVKYNGNHFIAEVSASLLRNREAQPANLIIIIKDITERLLYERKLKEARLRAIESDKLKTAFLANMSHEIRTPMNAIIGFSKLLSSRQANEADNTEYIEIIKNAGNTLLNLIDDIIDFAKIEAGEVRINQTECNVDKIMKELHSFFEKELVRNKKDSIDLLLKIPDPQNELIILTDQNRFRQIFSNLLSNAMKFTKKGRIEFGYLIEGNEITFYVSDSGIGIPEDKHKIIFERFRQAEFNYSKKTGGTGLGLAISQNLVKLLGGRIMVDSKKGEGSVFSFNLPLIRPDYPKQAYIKRLPDININNWEGKVILIVEDNELNSKLLQRMIEPTGAEIILARDGKPAIEACISNRKIDIVLMDIQMPEMDGYEATRAIKSLRPEIPVIAQTAYAMAEERERIISAGCDDYLSKPIRQKELFNILSKYLNQ
jgi:PAS domain S-box-containing protein